MCIHRMSLFIVEQQLIPKPLVPIAKINKWCSLSSENVLVIFEKLRNVHFFTVPHITLQTLLITLSML